MTLQEVDKIIKNLNWDLALKQRLIAVLPILGKNSLSVLGEEVSRGDSIRISNAIVQLWEKFASIFSQIKQGQAEGESEFSQMLAEMSQSLDQDKRYYFLSLLLDVKPFAYSGKIGFSFEEWQSIISYEIELFSSLPKEEILILLGQNFLELLKYKNLFMELQTLVYNTNWDYDSSFTRMFSDSLLKSKQNFPAGSTRTLGAWMRDFMNNISVSMSQRNSIQIAEFLVRDPEAIKLSKEDKKILSEALKIFVWFFNPKINVEQIDKYRQELAEQQQKKLREQFLKENPGYIENTNPLLYAEPEPFVLNLYKALDEEESREKSSTLDVKVSAPAQVASPNNKPAVAQTIQQTKTSINSTTLQMPRTLGSSGGVNVQRTLYTQNQNEPAGLRMEDLNLEQSPAVQLPKSPVPVPKKGTEIRDKRKEISDSLIQKSTFAQANIEEKLEALKKKVGKKE